MIEKKIKDQIKKALKELKLPHSTGSASSGQADVGVELEHPAEESHGDYSSNIAMAIFSKIKDQRSKIKKQGMTFKNPRELAEAIAGELRAKGKGLREINKIEVAGAGFINFWLSEEFLLSELKRVLHLKSLFGKSGELKGKKIMVEFAHPNTHKQFHIGHLRNICIGESLVRILEANGAKVVRTNYQGDVGLHVAKAVWGVMNSVKPFDDTQGKRKAFSVKRLEKKSLGERMKILGKAYAEASSAYESSKKAKEEIMQINKDIYEQKAGDMLEVWKVTRQWSLDYFGEIYKRLYTKYDRLYFESEVHEPGKKNSLQALKKGVLEKSKGAVVFNGEKYGLHTRVFLTGEGLPTYEAKELGLAPLEFSEFGKLDLNIHVVAPEQTSFFEVTFKVEEILDPAKYEGKQMHLRYGFVDLREGKMSSRKGVVVTGSSVIDEVKGKISKIVDDSDFSEREKEQVAEMVAVGAVKYAMLKQSLQKNISFSIDESISLEGDSGPYLQYTYARTKSVLEKANGEEQGAKSFADKSIKDDAVSNEEERAIVRWLYRYAEIVKQAGDEYAPSLICQYLFELAQRYNRFYNSHTILGGKSLSTNSSGKLVDESGIMNYELRNFRLGLTKAVGQVLENGLGLLGIKAPLKM